MSYGVLPLVPPDCEQTWVAQLPEYLQKLVASGKLVSFVLWQPLSFNLPVDVCSYLAMRVPYISCMTSECSVVGSHVFRPIVHHKVAE